ncbi:MAG: YciI family protein [Gammaproteobacteria bacterium]
MTEPVVTRDEIMQACEGMLRKQFFVVLTTPANGLGPVMENLEPHLKFQVELEEKGIMFGAGPFFTDDMKEWRGDGMVILRADTMEEADKIAASDPMHQSGARSYKIRPWLMNEGTMTLKVRFSDGSREIV